MASAIPKSKYKEPVHVVSSHIQIVLLLTYIMLFVWSACFRSSQLSVKLSQTLGKLNLNIWVSSAFIAQWARRQSDEDVRNRMQPLCARLCRQPEDKGMSCFFPNS